jgi:rhombotail lipoprotein
MKSRTTRHASSVVEFLYPGKERVVIQPSIPHLKIPLNVGIAFVPSSRYRYARHDLDPALRRSLMERISSQFRAYEFIKHIELIPTQYLRPGGGFTNLDQVKSMYGVDIIALLSYDQVQYTDENFLSVTYWTIVGAYIFPGEKNDTSTLMDAAVYDINSRKLLFRAPGTSQVKAHATLANLSGVLRQNSKAGFEKAADNLIVNLKSELERFKVRIKEKPDTVKITYSPSYRGGGYWGGVFSLVMIALLGAGLYREYKCRERKSV